VKTPKPKPRAKPKPKARPKQKVKQVEKKQGERKPAKRKSKGIDGQQARQLLLDQYRQRISEKKTLRPSEIKHMRQIESELDQAAGANGAGGTPKGNVILNMDDAAAYCGTSKKTVSYHIKQGKLKQNPDGTFARAELDKWLSRYGRPSPSGEAGQCDSIREQQEKAELRYRLARAKREEILTGQLEKTLAPWEEIERGWGERILLVKSALDAYSSRLPALLVGRKREEMEEIIKGETRELFLRFSTEGRYCPEC